MSGALGSMQVRPGPIALARYMVCPDAVTVPVVHILQGVWRVWSPGLAPLPHEIAGFAPRY